MDEEFTTTTYPNVLGNLKLPTEGKVRLEEPASSAGTLSSLQNLDKELSFTDQFLVEKSQEDELEKTNTEAEVQSMVTVPIHQDTSSVPLMTTPVIDIIDPQSDSTMVPASMPTTTATVTETTTKTTIPPPPQPQQDVSTSILTQTIGQLEQNIADLVDANQALEERLDKQGNRIHQLETQDLSRLIREQIVEFIDSQEIDRKIKESVKEVVTASVQHVMRAPLRARFKDLPTSDMKEILLQRTEQFDAEKAEEQTMKKSKQDSPKTPPGSPPPPPFGASGAFGPIGTSDSAPDPPPPPPSSITNQGDQSHNSIAPSSSKSVTSIAYTAWTTTTSRLEPAASSVPEDVIMHEESEFEAHDMGSDDEDSGSRYIPKPPASYLHQRTLCFHKPVILECLLIGSEGPTYEVVKAFHPDGDRLALSITKMKAAFYPDAGLEQMVPEEEYMYDISASYGISHWWFKRQQFYIERHSTDTNRRAIVRTHMRILSVVRIEVFSLYGYDYMKKIVLQRADNQEYTIAESDFKDLYPSDFEDLYLLNLQGHLNHLPPRDRKILSCNVNLWIRNMVIRKRVEDFQLGIESYQTQLNLTKPRWEATGLEFMHDYKILDFPRAVVFRDKYGMQMLMRFNEIHKFSDGTLQQIDEALDYRVKEFKVNKNNSALNTSSGESSGTWKALLVEEYAKENIDFYGEPNDDILSVASRLHKDGDADASFQWSQFTTPCSHLMFLIKDIMTTERPTTQLPQL
ncbi:hypothetical protein Tco_1019352 [Tanacetum coccineum]|uniref:Uncharacterized protein n=1 Tax=Tanacetum coccineum TaxID=301880 RepID=A0ABQ5FYT1_9ASTR